MVNFVKKIEWCRFALKIVFALLLIILYANAVSAQQNKDLVPSAKIIQKPSQTIEIEQKSEKITPPETKPAYGGGYYAGKAWEYYNKGDYKQAIDLFVFAQSFPEAKQEAKLGLAFCYAKQKKTEKAISFFEELAKSKYKLKDVLPSLIALLFKKENYKKANFYLKGLKGKDKRKWEKLIQERKIREKFSKAQKSGNMRALEQLINVYQKELKSCVMPELFHDTAQIFAVRGKRKEATNLYQDLLKSCSTRWDFRPAFLYGLKDILPAPEMLPLIQKELKRPSLPGKYRKQMAVFEADLYKEIIGSLEPGSPQVKELLERILAVQPEASFALTSLAWWYYDNKDYQTSYDMFSKLYRQFPEEKEKNFHGLILSLIRLGKPEQAMQLMEKAEIEDNKLKLTILKGMLFAVDSSAPLAKELAEKVLAISPGDYTALMRLAWWDYHHGSYQTAYEMFFNLYQKFPEKEGRLSGLIYTLIKLGKADEALNLYKQEKVEDAGLKRDILRLKLSLLDSSSGEARILAEEILKEFPDDLPTQATLAWWHYNHGEFKTAYEKFRKLYQKNPLYARGLLDSLIQLKDYVQFERIVEQLEIKDDTLNMMLGKRYAQIAHIMSGEEDYKAAEYYLKKALSFAPQDPKKKMDMGWVLFRQGRVDEALALALPLYEKRKTPRLAKLILFIYDKLGRTEDARLLVNIIKKKRSRLYKEIVVGYYSRQIWVLYKQEKMDEALTLALSLYEKENDPKLAEAVLLFYEKLDRDDDARLFVNSLKEKEDDAYQQIVTDYYPQLIWVLYKQEKVDEALTLALSLYEKENDPKLVEAILLFYEKLDRDDDARLFVNSLKEKEDDVFKKAAADYYFKRKWRIKAAQTYSHSDTDYFNVDKPWFEFSTFRREKSGTSGKSKMTENAYPFFRFHYPLPEGRSLSFQLRTTSLDSGQAPSDPEIGSFYKFEADPTISQNKPITTVAAVTPQIMYEKEGEINYTFKSGTTFLGGPISPLPTFFLQAKGRKWKFNIHQAQKDNSILSYAGQQDPYTSKKWGRVLKTGVEGAYSFSPFPSYRGSVKVGYDYYWGHNVWSNQSVETSARVGKSFSFNFFDISLGYSLTGRLFEHNTGFHSFGHGGYWSPDVYYSHGPFIGFESKKYRSYWFKTSFRPGFSHSESKSVSRYPLNPEISERNGGSKSSNIGFSYKVEGYKLLTPHWALGGFFSSNNNMTGGYRETNLGLNLRFYLSPRSVFLPPN